jgi:hypothetical protein
MQRGQQLNLRAHQRLTKNKPSPKAEGRMQSSNKRKGQQGTLHSLTGSAVRVHELRELLKPENASLSKTTHETPIFVTQTETGESETRHSDRMTPRRRSIVRSNAT